MRTRNWWAVDNFTHGMSLANSTLEILIKLRDQASAGLKSVDRNVTGLGSTMTGLGSTMASVTKIAGTFAASMATAGAVLGVKTAADLETARMGFVTLLGSAEEAEKVVQRLTQESKRTPFELVGLTQATQLLSSVTKSGDKSVDILLDIGEALAAMGKGQGELDRIIVNLQQVGAIGYASMVDIKQFAYAGIPIFEMLQTETGLAGDSLSEFISNGGVTFDMLTQMFDKANDEGGRFFNAFKNQAGTFNQVWSNMKDTVSIAMSEIVTQTGAFDGVKGSLLAMNEVMERNTGSIVTFVQTIQSGFAVALERVRSFFEATRPAWEFLGAMFINLWMVLRDQLLPALVQFWDPIGKTLALGLGVTLYGVVVLLTGVITALSAILAKLLTWLDAIATWIADVGLAGINLFIDAWEGLTGALNAVIESFKKMYEWAGKAISKAKDAVGLGGGKSKSVDDAVISPSGTIITTNPRDWLIATQNPLALAGGLGVSAGITINIGNVNGTDRDAARQLADMIAQEIKYRVRL